MQDLFLLSAGAVEAALLLVLLKQVIQILRLFMIYQDTVIK